MSDYRSKQRKGAHTPQARRLTQRESGTLLAVIDALAKDAFGDPAAPLALRTQLWQTMVIGTCGCGCATVSLDARGAERVESASDIVILTTNGQGESESSTLDIIDASGEHRGNLCVSTEDGWLTGMEVFSAGATITEIPHPGDLYLADGRSLVDAAREEKRRS